MADRRAQSGFTLVEVLVALVVFAIAAMALLNVHGENIRASAHVEQRLLAGIVAENALVEAMTGPALRPGVTSGAVDLADRRWDWTRAVLPTPDPEMARIDITVRLEGQDQVLALLSGFRGL